MSWWRSSTLGNLRSAAPAAILSTIFCSYPIVVHVVDCFLICGNCEGALSAVLLKITIQHIMTMIRKIPWHRLIKSWNLQQVWFSIIDIVEYKSLIRFKMRIRHIFKIVSFVSPITRSWLALWQKSRKPDRSDLFRDISEILKNGTLRKKECIIKI